jgi:AraC family transcriptional regulator
MNYKIIEKEAFKVIGKAKRVSTVDGKNYEIIPKFWEESQQNGSCEKLCEYTGKMGLLGICMEFSPEQEELTYVIASEKTSEDVPADFIEKEIPASTWAVFESVGPMPGAIQEVWKRIFAEWFPATGYEHADAPELEVYLPGNPEDENYKCEVWIPIIKK